MTALHDVDRRPAVVTAAAPTADTCPICGSSRISLQHDQGYRNLLKCSECRVVFADPIPTMEEKRVTEGRAYEGDVLSETSQFFNDYGRDFREDPVIRGFRATLERIERAHAKGSLLDVGPGTGIFLFLAAERGWKPHGIDICEASSTTAAREFDLRVDVGDFHEFPYALASFDCITMLDVVEHTRDPVAFLRRAYALLRPGGVLYVAVPNRPSLLTLLVDIYAQWIGAGARYLLDRLYVEPHVYNFSRRSLRHALEAAGFRIDTLEGESVYLGRYTLGLLTRVALEIILRVGSALNMPPRLIALARKPADAAPR